MKTDMLTLTRLFLCSMDIYMLYRFFKSMFPVRPGKRKLVLGFVAASFMIFFVNAFVNTILNLLVIPLLYFGFVILSFHISLSNGIVYVAIFYVIFSGGREVAFEILLRLLHYRFPGFVSPWFTVAGIKFLLIEYLFSFLFLLYIERFTKKLEIDRNAGYTWFLLFTPLSSFLILFTLMYMEFPDDMIKQIIMCTGAFLLYLSNAVVFIILAKLTTLMNQIKYDELYRVKQSMEDEQYQNIVKLNEYYRCYIHDIRSYLRHIRILALQSDNQSIITIIDDLDGDVKAKEVSEEIYSGNKVLNAVLSECKIRAQNSGVELSVFIEKFLRVDFISDADLISMFGNLFDNAMEAAEKCEEGNRKVNIKLFMGSQYMLTLYIENTFVIKAFRNGDNYITTKKDAGSHGLGIGIVRKLADKYGGNLNLQENDDTFVTTLTISTCQQIGGKSANFGRQLV